jgi:hypothetical protein
LVQAQDEADRTSVQWHEAPNSPDDPVSVRPGTGSNAVMATSVPWLMRLAQDIVPRLVPTPDKGEAHMGMARWLRDTDVTILPRHIMFRRTMLHLIMDSAEATTGSVPWPTVPTMDIIRTSVLGTVRITADMILDPWLADTNIIVVPILVEDSVGLITGTLTSDIIGLSSPIDPNSVRPQVIVSDDRTSDRAVDLTAKLVATTVHLRTLAQAIVRSVLRSTGDALISVIIAPQCVMTTDRTVPRAANMAGPTSIAITEAGDEIPGTEIAYFL